MKNKRIYTFIVAGLLSGTGAWAQNDNKDAQQKAPNVIQNTVTLDSVNRNTSINEITQKVIESTYKNFPPQPGQPSIIINNIVIPPDNKNQEMPANGAGGTFSNAEDEADYRAWLRERRYGRESSGRNYQESNFSDREKERNGLTFQERFAERTPRNSGTWVIPVAGVHALGFDADFKDDKFSGRTGWNAGLDIRMRARRFFVQPGLHYFSSSLEVTSKDSLSDAKLLDGPRIHSLKLPLMLGLYLTRANQGFFKFNIKAGAAANYLLSVDKTNLAQFNENNLHDFSYGLNGGIGLEFGFITIDVSHEWGITNFFKNSSQKNNFLRATLGFKI